MILVDTSVWIGFFNGVDSPAVRSLEEIIEGEEELFISEYILAEVLQGFRKDRDFELARRYLLSFPICFLKGFESNIRVAQIYRTCRKKGVTLRKTADCVIAQTAMENDLLLLHDDSDFDRIASVCPLAIYRRQSA